MMVIKQLSVFLENRSGRLTELTKILGTHQINISALSIADTAEYGLIRMIVDKPDEAIQCLKQKDFSVSATNVICLLTPDTPGALAKVLEILSTEGIDIAYMYGYSYGEQAAIIMKAEPLEKAVDILKQHKVKLLEASKFYRV